jgi:hypothetical protein
MSVDNETLETLTVHPQGTVQHSIAPTVGCIPPMMRQARSAHVSEAADREHREEFPNTWKVIFEK